MDLAHRRLIPDFIFICFWREAQIASAVIYACTTFGLSVFFSWGLPQLQSDWSLSCDHGLDYESLCENENKIPNTSICLENMKKHTSAAGSTKNVSSSKLSFVRCV